MKKSFLVLGLAWASMMTMAQSDTQQKKDTKPAKQSVTTARETGSGMATGRRNAAPSNPSPATFESGVTTARETGSGMATGRMAQAPTGTHHDVSARETATGMATGKTADPNSGLHQQNIVHRDLAAREASSGQASGLAVQNQSEAQDGERGIRESPTTTGRPHKTTGVDDWDPQQKNSMSGAQSNPMYKDNTKSGTNPLYESNSRQATKTRSNIQNNRVATGDVTGDGTADVNASADQQSAVRITKSRSNIQNNRVAAGDVDGDGVAEGVVKSKSNITNNLTDESARVKSNVKNNVTGDENASVAVSQSSGPAQMKGDLSRGHQPDRTRESDASAGKGASDKKTAPRDAATGQASGKRQHN